MNEMQLLENQFFLLDHIPVGACVLQADWTVKFWNKCLEEWTHISSLKIVGTKISDYFPHLLQPKYASRLQQIFEGGPPTIFSSQLHQYVIPATLHNGKFRIQHATVTSIPLPDNSGYYALLVIQDVTELTSRIQDYKLMRDQALEEIKERRQAEEQLQQKTRELERRNLELTQLSELNDLLQACLAMREAYPIIGQSIKEMFPNISGSLFMLDSSQQSMAAVTGWGDNFTSEKSFGLQECWALRRGRSHLVNHLQPRLLCKHICHRPLEYFCLPMIAQGEAIGVLHLSSQVAGQLGEAQQLLGVTVTEHIALALANLKLRETLHNQSIRDPLTGLYNRRYMEEFLSRELNRALRKQQTLGIIMLDVDRFKLFNDTFGHEAGDQVLRELGLFLQRHVRGTDIACRYGGEELILILPDASLETAWKRAELLRSEVKYLNVRYRRQLLGNITLSIGVACFPNHGMTADAVIRAADVALYQAKREGRDRVVAAS